MVSETQHTPGPWDYKNHGADHFFATNHQFGVASFHGHPRWIAQVEGLGMASEANARLIAAAPDLLAACEAVISAGESENLPTTVYGAVEAAIAKANGESAT